MNEYQLPKGQRILAVFAHPDDEAFGPGGTLALMAQKNQVTLICVTDGNRPERKSELRASAKILGIREVSFLGFKDGSLNNALYHQVAEKIQDHVDRFKPKIILTFEPRGLSGHLDHIAVSMITAFVFRENKTITELWYFCELEEMLQREEDHDHYFVYFPPGYTKDEVDLIVDTSSTYDTKLMAIRAHVSQKEDGEGMIRTRAGLPREECFKVIKRG